MMIQLPTSIVFLASGFRHLKDQRHLMETRPHQFLRVDVQADHKPTPHLIY